VSAACSNQPEPNTADKTFVAEMVAHHQLGVAMVDSAVLRSDDVRLRKLVFEMQNYHEHELHQLSSRLQEWKVKEAKVFPGLIDPIRLAKVDQLVGPSFDNAWLQAMIEHHEGAVVIGKNEITSGRIADLKAMATKIVDVQQAEILQMQRLLNSK
jgi:uncharacterized protein (DUF305 family)